MQVYQAFGNKDFMYISAFFDVLRVSINKIINVNDYLELLSILFIKDFAKSTKQNKNKKLLDGLLKLSDKKDVTYCLVE